MSAPRSPGQAAPQAEKRSIYFYFFTRLIALIACLAVLWGLVTVAILSGYPHGWHWLTLLRSGRHALAGAAVIAGTGIAIAVVAAAAMGLFARRLTREFSDLAMTARRLADEQHNSAVAAATAEAALRSGFQGILVSLGKRNQSLLHRQLRIIDMLEQQAASPAALADLFTLDHLTTRMRRHAESLTILSGAAPGRSWGGPVPVVDVVRAAAAEVEDYTRVTVMTESDEAVAASAVTDMIHLLAELIENATLFSPSSTRVEVRAERVANGFAIEVEDRGLGIPPDQLRELNAQLANPPDFDSADADRLGLFVAGRLAARHGVYVSLAPSPYRGIKAVVVLPEGVVIPAAQSDTWGKPAVALADGRPIRLNLHAPEVLSLSGAVTAGSSAAGTKARVTEEMAVVTVRGLPRRVRPGDQSGGERDVKPGAGAPAARQSPVESPAPDAARSLAASLQSSWHRSRQADDTLAQDSALDSSALDSED